MRRAAVSGLEVSGLVALVSLGWGCVVFSDLPRSGPSNRGAPVIETLRVFVDSGTDPNEESGIWQPYPASAHEKTALETLRRSGWARRVEVVSRRLDADLVLRVERYEEFSPTGALTLATLGLVPSRWKWSLKVKLTRVYPDGRTQTCLGLHHHDEWMELFLLPFMINHSPGTYERVAVARLTARCSAETLGEWPAHPTPRSTGPPAGGQARIGRNPVQRRGIH